MQSQKMYLKLQKSLLAYLSWIAEKNVFNAISLLFTIFVNVLLQRTLRTTNNTSFGSFSDSVSDSISRHF